MKNLTIRKEAKEKGVKLWQIADVLQISEPTMTRRLRHEMPPEETQKILAIIARISKEAKE